MPHGFPPLPIFPYAIDDNHTLYLVYNTTEAPLTANNGAWATEVPVQPAVENEVWADNGFATISGEIFYYDAVDKNSDGFVYNLRRCLRNIGGVQTQPNLAGTVVRGFVMAEHHNQEVEAIQRIEGFVGVNFSPDETTLDWRIRNLQETPIIFDDFSCPSLSFTFNIVSSNPASGVLTEYFIQITGTYNQFTLDFGDGTSTNSTASGQHQYAPNAVIDPVITIANDQCQMVQTPIQRTQTATPQPALENNTILLPIPVCPAIGDIFIQPFSVPPLDIVIPPIIFPCLNISPFPSTFFGPISIAVDFSPLNIPSEISIVGTLNIPSTLSIIIPSIPNISIVIPSNVYIPSIISIIAPDIPSVISIVVPDIPNISLIVPNIPDISMVVPTIPDISLTVPTIPDVSLVVPVIPDISLVVPAIPNVSLVVPTIPDVSMIVPTIPDISLIVPTIPDISLIVPAFPEISYGTPPTFPDIGFSTPPIISFGTPPAIPINWGSAPTIPINVTVTANCACCPASSASTSSTMMMLEEPEFVDQFNPFLPEWNDKPDALEMNYDFRGFPSVITIAPPVIPDIKITTDLPSYIELVAPDKMLIEYLGPSLPSQITIVAPEKPLRLEIDMPKSIKLDASDVMDGIRLLAPAEMPILRLDASMLPSAIQVVGIPSIISVSGMPSSIMVQMPENPTIQMLPPVEPIPVSVTVTLALDNVQQMLTEQQKTKGKCFMMVECI